MVIPGTPVKVYKIGCCLCLDPNPSRKHNLSGDKCKNEKIPEIIQLLTGIEIAELDLNILSVCRPCLIKLKNFEEFRSVAIDSITVIKQRPEVTKRCHLSPVKPPSEESSDGPVTSTPKPRKKVCRELCMPRAPVNPLTLSTLSMPDISSAEANDTEASLSGSSLSDHSYSDSDRSTAVAPPVKDECLELLQSRGVQWNQSYSLEDDKLPKAAFEDLLQSISGGNVKDISQSVCRIGELKVAVQKLMLEELNSQVTALMSRTRAFQSCLLKFRNIEELENADKFFEEVVCEMDSRCPMLLDVLLTAMTPNMHQPTKKFLGPLVTVYGILLHQRDMNLSAFQRLLTLVSIKGRASDEFLTVLNKLGLTLGTTSKLNLLDECVRKSKKRLTEQLGLNGTVKITGDNLDVYVRTQVQSTEKSNTDLHMFTSNLIFSRVFNSHLSNEVPAVQPIVIQDILLCKQEEERLLDAYAVLVGRLLGKFSPSFQWLETILPKHIPHRHSVHMEQKSKVMPLPIVMRNESAYEECFDILDAYEEQVVHLFENAHGNTDVLDQKKVVVGGDQLTRVRLQGAHGMRNHAEEAMLRYAHLGPYVIEMWHNKQDMLHKAYKALFSKGSAAQKGTLYFFKTLLKKKDVNGNVKANFKAHWDLLTTVGGLCIVEQAIEFFGMEDAASPPTRNKPPANIAKLPRAERSEAALTMLKGFLRHSKYMSFKLDPTKEPEKELQYKPCGRKKNGQLLMAPTTPLPDALGNYARHLCHWTLQLLELHDTAKEGDMERLILNCKGNIPLFFSHAAGSKYYIENVDFVLKSSILGSPQMQNRILEGAFINMKGGAGNNVEADLVQEHSVRNRKDLIRGLGANKTEKAIQRVTSAADQVVAVVKAVNDGLAIRRKSGRHTSHVSEADRTFIRNVFRELRPFSAHPGRPCVGFPNIKPDPTMRIDHRKFLESLLRNVRRLANHLPADNEVEDDEDEDENEDEEGAEDEEENEYEEEQFPWDF